MNPSAREGVLFQAAARLTGRTRVAFLDRACARDPRPVRAALLRDEKASPAPPFWRALMLADLQRPVEAVAAYTEGERRLSAGPLSGWDLRQATAGLYMAHALRLEARQSFQRHGIAAP